LEVEKEEYRLEAVSAVEENHSVSSRTTETMREREREIEQLKQQLTAANSAK